MMQVSEMQVPEMQVPAPQVPATEMPVSKTEPMRSVGPNPIRHEEVDAMSIESLIQREVETISPETSCADAAARMLDANVGCLVVSTPDATPVGIVTDRDLAVRVVAGRLDPEKPVREVMTSDPIFLSETTTLQGVISTMRDLRLRRMVVVDDDRRMCGIIALDDVVMHLGDSLAGVSEAIRSELRT